MKINSSYRTPAHMRTYPNNWKLLDLTENKQIIIFIATSTALIVLIYKSEEVVYPIHIRDQAKKKASAVGGLSNICK